MTKDQAGNWASKASKARLALEGVREGEREATLRSLAGGQNANTLRRSIKALAFAEEVGARNPSLFARLVDAPVSVVELFARWHEFDPDEAAKRLRKWQRDGGSVRDIADKLGKARELKRKLSPRSIDIGHRERMKDSVKRMVARRLDGPIKEMLLNYKDSDLPAADYFVRSDDPSTGVSIKTIVLVAGPFSNPDMYRRKMSEVLMRAFAFAWVYDLVILLVPASDQLTGYRQSIDRFASRARATSSSRRPMVDVVHLSDKKSDPSATA
jgi:hypothetical protein